MNRAKSPEMPELALLVVLLALGNSFPESNFTHKK